MKQQCNTQTRTMAHSGERREKEHPLLFNREGKKTQHRSFQVQKKKFAQTHTHRERKRKRETETERGREEKKRKTQANWSNAIKAKL